MTYKNQEYVRAICKKDIDNNKTYFDDKGEIQGVHVFLKKGDEVWVSKNYFMIDSDDKHRRININDETRKDWFEIKGNDVIQVKYFTDSIECNNFLQTLNIEDIKETLYSNETYVIYYKTKIIHDWCKE